MLGCHWAMLEPALRAPGAGGDTQEDGLREGEKRAGRQVELCFVSKDRGGRIIARL